MSRKMSTENFILFFFFFLHKMKNKSFIVNLRHTFLDINTTYIPVKFPG